MGFAILPNEYIVTDRHMVCEYLSLICGGRFNFMGILSVADTCLVNICHLYVLGELTKWVYCQWPANICHLHVLGDLTKWVYFQGPAHVLWISVTCMCWTILPDGYIVSGRHMSSEYLSLICVWRAYQLSIVSVAGTCLVNICHLYVLGNPKVHRETPRSTGKPQGPGVNIFPCWQVSRIGVISFL